VWLRPFCFPAKLVYINRLNNIQPKGLPAQAGLWVELKVAHPSRLSHQRRAGGGRGSQLSYCIVFYENQLPRD